MRHLRRDRVVSLAGLAQAYHLPPAFLLRRRRQLAHVHVLHARDLGRPYLPSRSPGRINKLQEASLLSIRPQRGTLMLRIAVEEVMNARFVLEAVETAVARAAAAMRPAGLPARLRALLAEQERAAAAEDSIGFLRLDEAYQRALAEGIGRGFAWTVLEGIKAQMDRVRLLSVEGATPLRELVRQHRVIMDAVAAGDAEGAEVAMRVHLWEILASLSRAAEAHPDYFALPARARPRLEG